IESPPSRVVNSVAYRHGKRVGPVTIDDISEVVKIPDTFIWLGLHEADPSLLVKVQEEFGLHELAVEDALKAHQRPKIETYGDSLFIVVKTAQMLDEKITYGETHIFVGKNFLISVRHGCSQGYVHVRARSEEKPQMLAKGPAYALYALLDFISDNYQPVVSHFEKAFEGLEGDIFKGVFNNDTLERLYDMKIELLQLRNAVAPIEDVCLQLMRLHHDLIPKDMGAYFRDVHDHAARIISTLDNLREMLTAAMQVNLALVQMRQNEVVKRLAGWGAVLAVPTVVFSLYGMNFEVMPELHWHFSYPVVLAATAGICIFMYRKLKESGYL
ncbi:MAG: corA, partial [Verrucomicrobiaceae bacterium]|nr:corA [Verrucomicrobiaceae bacterium]